jgi:pyrroloquinoline quinone biosynthesis protein B
MTIEAILLGIAQDAGVPQAGCYCPNCQRARTDPQQRQLVVSLGLLDRSIGQSWMIDATPDFREQLHVLHDFAPDCPLAGILLTHAHIGHYTGLIHLGQEAMNTRALPVYVTARLAILLRENAPWSQLVDLENIQLQPLTPGREMWLSEGLSILPVLVPHRDELSDTLAFVVRGPGRSLFYCPDIDSWDEWNHNLRSFVANLDLALLDAPFFSPAELPGRNISQIRHPLVSDTISRLAGVPCQVCLIHLNHSNPLLNEGAERRWVQQQGFEVGRLGQSWRLDVAEA